MTRMNTAVTTPAHVTSHTSSTDVYDADDVGGSPVMSAFKPNLAPSPSPEPLEVAVKAHPKKGPRKKLPRSSMGEGVLVHFMANGKYPELSRQVATAPLPTNDDDRSCDEGSTSSSSDDDCKSVSCTAEDGGRSDPKENESVRVEVVEVKPTAQSVKGGEESLEAMAAKAYHLTKKQLLPRKEIEGGGRFTIDSVKRTTIGEPMEGVKPSVTILPSIAVNPTPARPLLGEATALHSKSDDDLAPIQKSPNSPGRQMINLPSLSSTFGDIKIPDTPRDAGFPQSPPARPPLFHQGSPPRSPLDFRDRALPSPALFLHQQRRHSQADQHAYATSPEYSSSTVETPSDKSTPGGTLGLARMSIDGLDNPQIGGYQCVYPGCSAQAFQTQYLLNSHANVHSQNRPHYCPVKGCGRSEGGKGFKRKNEMIRHGLVHDSPGYVCPFCPDREHKYPRPDNLQRHVRVHHVDKDKDDPQLRDVLAQRPEGPSRGRRRRGTTG